MTLPDKIFAKWLLQAGTPRNTGSSATAPSAPVKPPVPAPQKPVTPVVGDRLFALFDATTGQAQITSQQTNYPLYFDPLKKQLTPKKTTIPALYGMVQTEIDIADFTGTAGVGGAITKDREDLFREQERMRVDPGRYFTQRPQSQEDMLSMYEGIKAGADRLVAIDQQMDRLRHYGMGRGAGPVNPNDAKKLTELGEEKASILRQASRGNLSYIITGREGEAEMVTPPGLSGDVIKDLGSILPGGNPSAFPYFITSGSRFFHGVIAEARTRSPMPDLVGSIANVLGSSPAVSGGLAWSTLTSPITYIKQGMNFAANPNITTEDAVKELVRWGWDVQDAQSEVAQLESSAGKNVVAWFLVNTQARLAPMGEKYAYVNQSARAFLEDLQDFDPLDPLQTDVRELRIQRRAEAAKANLTHGEAADRNLNQMILSRDAALAARMTDFTGETTRLLIEESVKYARVALDEQLARGDIPDFTYRHTWVVTPDGKDMEEQAKNALAEAMAQKGDWLETWEIEAITERFADPMVELGGDAIFDLLNFVPGKVWETLLVGPIKSIFGTVSRLGMRVKPIRMTAEWLGKESVVAGASKQANITNRVLNSIRRATPDMDSLRQGITVAIEEAQKVGSHTADELRRFGLNPKYVDEVSKTLTEMAYKWSDEGRVAITLQEAGDKLLKYIDDAVVATKESKVENLIALGTDPVEAEIIAAHYASDANNVLPHLTDDIANDIVAGRKTWSRSSVLDEGIISWFGEHGLGKRAAEFMLTANRTFWRVWAGAVLTMRPGFFVWNTLDTITRAIVDGANPFDNLSRISRTMPGGFEDELLRSFTPGEIGAEHQIDLTRKYLHEGGIRSFADVGLEAFKKHGGKGIIGQINNSAAMMREWHSAMEAAWRVRLFSSHLERQLSRANRLYHLRRADLIAENGLEGVLRQAADELEALHPHDGNAFRQAADEFISGRKGVASNILPPGSFEAVRAQFGDIGAQRFVAEVSGSLRRMIDDGTFTEVGVDRYFGELLTNVREDIRRSREAAAAVRGSQGDLNTNTTFDHPGPTEEKVVPPVAPDSEASAVPPAAEVEPDVAEAFDYARKQIKGGQSISAETDMALRDAEKRYGAIEAEVNAELGNLNRLKREARLADPGNEELRAASDRVGDWLDDVNRIQRGSMRRFIHDEFLGGGEANSNAIASRWRKWRVAMGQMSQAMAEESRALSAMLRDGRYEDIIARPFPTPQEWWHRAGWKVETEGGSLSRIQTPFDLPTYWHGDQSTLYRFLKANGATEDEARNLISRVLEEQPHKVPTTAASLVDEIAEQGEQAAAQSARQARMREIDELSEAEAFPEGKPAATTIEEKVPTQDAVAAARKKLGLDEEFQTLSEQESQAAGQVVADAAEPVVAAEVAAETDVARATDTVVQDSWGVTLDAPIDGLNGLKFVYGNAKMPNGTKTVLNSFENLETYLSGKINAAVQAGDVATADRLRLRLAMIRQNFRQELLRRGRLDVADALIPNPERYADQGTLTWMHMGGQAETNEQVLTDIIDDIRTYSKTNIRAGTWWSQKLAPEEGVRLKNYIDEAADLKERALQVSRYGTKSLKRVANDGTVLDDGLFLGTEFEGALPATNAAMVDYGTQARWLRYLRNIYPFIRFQAKSLPFWSEVMLSHPNYAAFYMKYLQSSDRFAYQRGAVDRNGRPRPSLYGHIPIPGTNTWVPVFAPFSFRYLFAKPDHYDEQEAEDRNIMQALAAFGQETGTMFATGMHPLITLLAYETGALKPTDAQRQALVPQWKLIPPFLRTVAEDALRRSRGGAFAADLLNPETSFADYVIYDRILSNANDAISDPDMGIDEKREIVANAAAAIDVDQRVDADGKPINQAGYDMWVEARNQVLNDEWLNNLTGYFTGIYGKAFTDADALLTARRHQMNILKRSMNNEVGASILDLDSAADLKWDSYVNEKYNTPEGYLNGLRDLIGWSITPEGKQLYGDDYEKYVAIQVKQDADMDAFYDGVAVAKQRLEVSLSKYPVGSKLRDQAKDDYSDTMSALLTDDVKATLLETNKSVGYRPQQLVYEQFREMWFKMLRATAPQKKEEEDWTEWRARYDEWKQNVMEFVPSFIRTFRDMIDKTQIPDWEYNLYMNMTPEEQSEYKKANPDKYRQIKAYDPNQYVTDIIGRLVEETTVEGYDAWDLESDSLSDAIEHVYTKNYVDEYFSATDGKKHEDFRLAERSFYGQWDGSDNTPTEQQLVEWVKETYGDRFTEDQIRKALRGREVLTPDERAAETRGPLRPLLEDAFNVLSLVAPGWEYGKFLDAYRSVGGKEDDLGVIFNPITGEATKEDQLPSDKSKEWLEGVVEKINQAAKIMGLDEVSDGELAERGAARKLNDQLKTLATAKYGEDFFTMYEYYWGLSLSEQSEFRKNQPDEHAMIKEYRKDREAFGVANPIWAKYYLEPGKTPSAGGGAGRSGAGRGGIGGAGVRPGLPGGFAAPGLRSSLDVFYLRPDQLGRAGATRAPIWPKWLLDKIGRGMAEEVANLVNDGVVLPSQVEQYLKSLAAKNSDALPIIEQTLVLNEKAKIAQPGHGTPGTVGLPGGPTGPRR